MPPRGGPVVPTKFQHVLDHLDVAAQLAEIHLARARAESKDTSKDGLLASLVADASEDIEGEVGMEVLALLERSPGPAVKLTYRFDPMVTRAFAYTAPVLAAALLWNRDLKDKRRGPEAIELIARTGMWLVGRSPLPDLATLAGRNGKAGKLPSAESTATACRIAGLWLARLTMARGIPSSLGVILTRGLDYYAMWACGAVANRYYDDFQLTLEEASEVARQALDFKRALVAALVRTARADGRFSYEEEELLSLYLDHLAFSDEDKQACLATAQPGVQYDGGDVLKQVKLPAHREYIVARAVEMAFADLKETRSEKETVRDLAKTLGVSLATVKMHESTMRAMNRTITGH